MICSCKLDLDPSGHHQSCTGTASASGWIPQDEIKAAGVRNLESVFHILPLLHLSSPNRKPQLWIVISKTLSWLFWSYTRACWVVWLQTGVFWEEPGTGNSPAGPAQWVCFSLLEELVTRQVSNKVTVEQTARGAPSSLCSQEDVLISRQGQACLLLHHFPQSDESLNMEDMETYVFLCMHATW